MTKIKPKSADDLFEAGGSVRRQDPQPASASPRDPQPVETDDGPRGREKKRLEIREDLDRREEKNLRAAAAPSRARARARNKKPAPAREKMGQTIIDPAATASVPARVGEIVPFKPPREDVALVAAIANAATNPNTNVAVMRELRDTLREAREQLARNAASRDFLALQRVLPEVKKDGTIDMGTTSRGAQGVKSKYVRFESMHKAVIPLALEHSFTISFENVLRGGTDNAIEVVVGILEHSADPNGQYDAIVYRRTERILTPDTTGAKNAQQAKAAGSSYLKRYMTIDLLNIRSLMPEAADLDGNDPEKVAAAEAKAKEDAKPATAAQIKELRAKIEKADGLSEERVCEKYGVPKLEDLPMKALADAHKALDNWIAARNGQAASHG